jgi:hypothetical protein
MQLIGSTLSGRISQPEIGLCKNLTVISDNQKDMANI